MIVLSEIAHIWYIFRDSFSFEYVRLEVIWDFRKSHRVHCKDDNTLFIRIQYSKDMNWISSSAYYHRPYILIYIYLNEKKLYFFIDYQHKRNCMYMTIHQVYLFFLLLVVKAYFHIQHAPLVSIYSLIFVKTKIASKQLFYQQFIHTYKINLLLVVAC